MADNIYNEKIDYFYGGMAEDSRLQQLECSVLSQHFDLWTHPKKLVPFRAMEADETTDYRIRLFAYDNATLWAAGRKGASDTTLKVYKKTANASLSSSWAAATSGEDSETDSDILACFLVYHGVLYGNGTLKIWAYKPSTTTFTSEVLVVAGIQCQGIVTSDDKLIIPTLTDVVMKDGEGAGPTANWSTALEFDDGRQISDLTEFGDLVAFARRPSENSAPEMGSVVSLWDKVNSDISQSIDWGPGSLRILENLEGTLIGVSVESAASEGGIKNKLVIRQWSGGSKARVIGDFETGSATLSVGPNYTKISEGSKFSFAIKITIDGTQYIQMATIGRKNGEYPLSFQLSHLVDNTTAVTAINGAFKLNDTVFISHNGDGSVNRTDDSANYTTATYITQKLTGENKVADAHRKYKALTMAGLLTEPLPSGATASLYYRVNEASSWTLIRTYSTVNGMGFEAGKSNDDVDFTNYRELQFKVESTGGAVITGIIYAWKFVGADINSD